VTISDTASAASVAEHTKNYLIEHTLDVCRRIAFDDPSVVQLTGLDAAAATDRLIDEVYALRHRMDADPPSATDYQDYFEPSLFLLDLSILALSDWAEECRVADAAGRTLCWHAKAEHKSGALETVLVNLANGLVATRMLILRGLFVQARTLARTNGELADLAIAMLSTASSAEALAPAGAKERAQAPMRLHGLSFHRLRAGQRQSISLIGASSSTRFAWHRCAAVSPASRPARSRRGVPVLRDRS
jgi:hypothetical protein